MNTSLLPALPETLFDIFYLLFAILSGIQLLRKADGRKSVQMMGIAALLLGLGDAFHLVPRILNFWVPGDWNAALGIGKMVTSITVTLFYLILEYIRRERYRDNQEKSMLINCWILSVLRIIVCLFPQNNWTSGDSPLVWVVIRNIPFVMIGIMTVVLWFHYAKQDQIFHYLWLAVLLSFLFYIPVPLLMNRIPMIGILMFPKTFMYIWMILMFRKAGNEEKPAKKRGKTRK